MYEIFFSGITFLILCLDLEIGLGYSSINYYSRAINNKISKSQERCVRTVYYDNKSSYKELSETDKSIAIQIKNLQFLATELFRDYIGTFLPLSRDKNSAE